MVDEALTSPVERSTPGVRSSSSAGEENAPFRFDAAVTLEWVRQQIAQLADERGWTSEKHSPRNLLFALTKELGDLGEVFQWKSDTFPVKGKCLLAQCGGCARRLTVDTIVATEWKAEDRARLCEELSDVLLYLVLLADKCSVDLPTAAHEKMVKNARKYPRKFAVEPLAVEAPPVSQVDQGPEFRFEAESTLERFRLETVHFADERGWAPNLRPRNLLLALTAEVGELCEIFQWKGDDTAIDDWMPEERVHLGEELSDVLLYLVQLADQSFADLASGVRDRLGQMAAKYPPIEDP
ncbi:Xtp3-transactivated protein [Globisporangium polare]